MLNKKRLAETKNVITDLPREMQSAIDQVNNSKENPISRIFRAIMAHTYKPVSIEVPITLGLRNLCEQDSRFKISGNYLICRGQFTEDQYLLITNNHPEYQLSDTDQLSLQKLLICSNTLFPEELPTKKPTYDCHAVQEMLEHGIEDIVFDPQYSYAEAIDLLGARFQKIFKSLYVEFLILESSQLHYQSITSAEWVLKILNNITGFTAIKGMKIPLFEGSFFREFIESNKLSRKFSAYADRFKSLSHFVNIHDPQNQAALQKVWLLMNLFQHKEVHQIKLMINGHLYGYFSFLEAGKLTPEETLAQYALSSKVGEALMQRMYADSQQALYNDLPASVITLQAKQDPVSHKTREFIITFANKAFQALYDTPISVSQNIRTLPNPLIQALQPMLENLCQEGVQHLAQELTIPALNKTFDIILSRTPGYTIQVTLTDITRNKQQEEMIYWQATHDGLTKLHNRSFFTEQLNEEILLARRHNQPLALLLMDLDKFKPINDTYGHAIGDKALTVFAEALKKALRESDIIARLGGDEFIASCEVHSPEDVLVITKKIETTLNSMPIEVAPGKYIHLKTSIGWAILDQTMDKDTFIKAADRAMYYSKQVTGKPVGHTTIPTDWQPSKLG